MNAFFASTYAARVIYQYEVYGVTHFGKRLGFNEIIYGTKKEAQASLARYPENSEVTVYYDPQKPDYAILNREYRP